MRIAQPKFSALLLFQPGGVHSASGLPPLNVTLTNATHANGLDEVVFEDTVIAHSPGIQQLSENLSSASPPSEHALRQALTKVVEQEIDNWRPGPESPFEPEFFKEIVLNALSENQAQTATAPNGNTFFSLQA